MIALLANWLLSALLILLVSQFVPGFVVSSITTALIVALILGILNALIKPILLIITLPINIVTFGLFTFVINALLLLATSMFVQGFHIDGFFPALLAAFLLWILSTIINFVIFPTKDH